MQIEVVFDIFFKYLSIAYSWLAMEILPSGLSK